jgi:hypothetical protein
MSSTLLIVLNALDSLRKTANAADDGAEEVADNSEDTTAEIMAFSQTCSDARRMLENEPNRFPVYFFKQRSALVMDAMFTRRRNVLLQGPAGTSQINVSDNAHALTSMLGCGKCLRVGTEVLMYDGTIRKVEDIAEGEFVMGDDSTPRRVTGLMNGYGPIYKIQPTKGDAYYVNANHILTLRNGSKPKVKTHKTQASAVWYEGYSQRTHSFKFSDYDDNEDAAIDAAEQFLDEVSIEPSQNIYDISVQDYLALSSGPRAQSKGFRVPVDFEGGAAVETLPIDPWILGYWLGDGTSATSAITTADQEVIDEFQKWCDASGGQQRLQKTTDKYGYRINGSGTNISHRPGSNDMLSALKRLNLLYNKHIPQIYKTACREARLQLLAGLMDSDGSLNPRGTFDFVQKNERLFDDTLFVARSLGFACFKQACVKTCVNNGVSGNYFRTFISGEIMDIPTRVHRKQYKRQRSDFKNVLNYGITVTLDEDNGHYYGFELDGNGRFVLADFSVTHNTTLTNRVYRHARDTLNLVTCVVWRANACLH